MNNKPNLIIITGPPGSGKTTLSKKLILLMKYPVISRDELKEGYVNTFRIKHSELPKNTNKIVTESFFEFIELALRRNISLIAEAAFQHKVWKKYLGEIKADHNTSIVICEVNKRLAVKRHIKRGLDDPTREFYHGDPIVSHYKQTGEVPEVKEYNPPKLNHTTFHISTKNGYSPSLKSLVEQLTTENHAGT